MPEVLLVPDMKLFAGNATPELAQRIANRLYTSLGDAAVGRFSDGEVSVQINENVRGGDIFIIQSTCAPTNDNLMELVVMVDALRRASAGVLPPLFLTLVMPVRTAACAPHVYLSPQKLSRIFSPA
jgi:ribose-phosphate pyrophosphokinase